jgi:hypothetical protein
MNDLHKDSHCSESVLDDPLFTAERTVFRRALLRPLENAVKVEVVQALALDGHAVISWDFAARAGRLEGELADRAALLVFDVPLPGGNCVPAIDFHLHFPSYYSNYNNKKIRRL